ncbi:hypothetical protein ABPG75_001519 [Micractinium tetrahymenae]
MRLKRGLSLGALPQGDQRQPSLKAADQEQLVAAAQLEAVLQPDQGPSSIPRPCTAPPPVESPPPAPPLAPPARALAEAAQRSGAGEHAPAPKRARLEAAADEVHEACQRAADLRVAWERGQGHARPLCPPPLPALPSAVTSALLELQRASPCCSQDEWAAEPEEEASSGGAASEGPAPSMAAVPSVATAAVAQSPIATQPLFMLPPPAQQRQQAALQRQEAQRQQGQSGGGCGAPTLPPPQAPLAASRPAGGSALAGPLQVLTFRSIPGTAGLAAGVELTGGSIKQDPAATVERLFAGQRVLQYAGVLEQPTGAAFWLQLAPRRVLPQGRTLYDLLLDLLLPSRRS